MNLQILRAKLSRLEQQKERLEKQLETGAKKRYETLPAKVGLKNIDELILELMPYASPRIRSQVGANGHAAPAQQAKRGRPAKSKGVRYSPETKDAIKAALEKGGVTVAELSKQYGASSFSINQWKKQWGLTKARKKK